MAMAERGIDTLEPGTVTTSSGSGASAATPGSLST